MPAIGMDSTDATLEAQVFWIRYRKEIIGIILIAVIGVLGFAGYRFYRDRRENAAAAVFASAKSASDFQQVIDRYGDTPSAASAYLLLAEDQRKAGKFSEANSTLQKFIEKFPKHELVSAAWMSIAANWEAMGKQDEAFAAYQQLASSNTMSFNAPFALLAQVRILQSKNRPDEARRLCETIITRYNDSFASAEARRLLRVLKPTASSSPAPAISPSLHPVPPAPSISPPASPKP